MDSRANEHGKFSTRGRIDSEMMSMIEDTHRMLTALFSICGESVLPDAVSTDSQRAAHHLDFEGNVSVSYGCVDLITHPNMHGNRISSVEILLGFKNILLKAHYS